MLMVISFPVPHADGSVNSNHKKGACPSGHGPFFVCNRLNQDLQDFRICRIEIRKGKRKVLTPYSEGQIEISVASAMKWVYSNVTHETDGIYSKPPAQKVIACVLSLGTNYEGVVPKRIRKFEENHPDVNSITELKKLIAGQKGNERGCACVAFGQFCFCVVCWHLRGFPASGDLPIDEGCAGLG